MLNGDAFYVRDTLYTWPMYFVPPGAELQTQFLLAIFRKFPRIHILTLHFSIIKRFTDGK